VRENESVKTEYCKRVNPFRVYCEKLSPSKDSNHGTKRSALMTIVVIIIIIIIIIIIGNIRIQRGYKRNRAYVKCKNKININKNTGQQIITDIMLLR